MALIRALPIWSGAIEVEPLDGGITNLNYRVTDGATRYAVRCGSDDAQLGISRRNEQLCAQLAARAGLAPAVVHAADGVLVSAFVDGVPLTPESAREPAVLGRVAQALRGIHALGSQVAGHFRYFCPFLIARSYVELAAARGLALPDADPERLLAEVAALQAQAGPFLPSLCHGDPMPGNFLDAGDRLWVIDWEYAGMGNPLFDVAGFASNCDLGDEADRALLAAYCGDAPLPWPAFRALKAAAALRESLWAVIQGSKSAIDFDYAGYRDACWARYRASFAAR
jgi:thiamine kinase-like enzyme